MVPYVHPVVAALCFVCGIYALYLGIRGKLGRGRGKHESFGMIALGGFIFVSGVGLGFTFQNWRALLVFKEHFYAAMAVIPFAVIGLASGHILMARKKKGALSVVHGICMLACMALACRAAYTGFTVLQGIF